MNGHTYNVSILTTVLVTNKTALESFALMSERWQRSSAIPSLFQQRRPPTRFSSVDLTHQELHSNNQRTISSRRIQRSLQRDYRVTTKAFNMDIYHQYF